MRSIIAALVLTLLAASAWGAWQALGPPRIEAAEPSVDIGALAQVESAPTTGNPDQAVEPSEPEGEVAPDRTPPVLLPRDETGRTVRDVTPDGAVAWPDAEEPPVRLPALEPPPEPARPPDWRRLARPLIEDPGSFRDGGLTVRLSDVTPPALDRTCGARPCGVQARAALRRFVRGRSVECMLEDDVRSGEHEAICRFGKTDLAAWMARGGWLVDAEGGYAAMLDEAKEARRGLYRP